VTATGYDQETWLIRPGRLAPPVVCVTTAASSSDRRLYARADGHMRNAFLGVLNSDPIYGANVAYDMCCALREWPDLFHRVFEAYDDNRVIDVGLSQQLIDNAKGRMTFIQHTQGYSLAALEKRWLKRDRTAEKGPDAWRLRYRELHDVPADKWPKEAIEYPLDDADGPLLIGEAQWDSIDRKYLADSPAQARAAFALQLLMCWGVKTDPDKIERLRAVASETYERVSVGLVAAGLVRKDGTRNIRLAQARMLQVCKEAGLRPKLTEAGYEKFMERVGEKKQKDLEPDVVFTEEELIPYLSVDEDACNESGDQLLKDYSTRTQLHNILNTHVPDLLKGVSEPIQPRYITLVESGRTACAKSRAEGKNGRSPTNGFQFQNPKRALNYFPKGVGIRECFEARPGKLYADDDFGGLELCTGAQACMVIVGYSKLGEALNAGRDPHLEFGAKLMGISYEEALSRKHEKEIKFYRQLGKVWNFGKPGGLGNRGMVGFARGYGVKLTLEDCRKYNDEWGALYPEWVEYFKWIRDHIDPISGRGQIEQLYVKRTRGGVTFTQASNSFFQALGADGAKAALYEVQRRCYVKEAGSVLYGVRPVGFIHDEILAEVDEDRAHEQAFEMAKVMVDACNKYLPDVPVKCVPALSKRWSKDAEAIFNKEGRLQPYDLARDGRWDVYWDAQATAKVKWT